MGNEFPEKFSYDDILLVPQYSEVVPSEVDVSSQLTERIKLNIPFLSAAMDTVTEHNMAIAIAQQGGLGIIHRNIPIDTQAEEIKKVKRYEAGMISNPLTIVPDATVGEAVAVMKEYSISGLPVVENGKLKGILTHRDLRFEDDMTKKVSDLMTPKPITIQEGYNFDDAVELLHNHRIEKLPVVDENNRLVGLITVKDIQKSREYPDAVKDKYGRLLVGAAVGVGKDMPDRADALVSAGADAIIIDTAHGDSKNVVETTKYLRKQFPDVDIIPGNVATADGVKRLIDAGADAIKVGVGPGSICTTRVVTGSGVPQASAVMECVKEIAKFGKQIIADGGIRYSGDIAKAIGLGAGAVMVGNLFAGTDEAPGETILFEGRRFKVYRGMGSLGAMKRGARDRYHQENVVDESKLVPEGIEGRVPYKGPVTEVIFQLLGGLRAGMSISGADNIKHFQNKAKFIRITFAGMRESHPHSLIITKEAPNYKLN
ncbi:IMP dehydrogenase [bacterium]|nr:MAG: IMP dehydrogenase [bacterium]